MNEAQTPVSLEGVLVSISARARRLRAEITSSRGELAHLQKDYDRRKVQLVPADNKWPGSNSEERKVAEQRTYANDQTLTDLEDRILDAQGRVAVLQASVDDLHDSRKTVELVILDRLCLVLGARYGFPFVTVGEQVSQAVSEIADVLAEDLLPAGTEQEQQPEPVREMEPQPEKEETTVYPWEEDSQ